VTQFKKVVIPVAVVIGFFYFKRRSGELAVESLGRSPVSEGIDKILDVVEPPPAKRNNEGPGGEQTYGFQPGKTTYSAVEAANIPPEYKALALRAGSGETVMYQGVPVSPYAIV
jgi:hypothetical protein